MQSTEENGHSDDDVNIIAKVKEPFPEVKKNYLIDNIKGNLDEGVTTWIKDNVNYRDMMFNMYFISKIEPNNFKESLNNELWVSAMQEELVQFKRNKV